VPSSKQNYEGNVAAAVGKGQPKNALDDDDGRWIGELLSSQFGGAIDSNIGA